MVAKIHPKGPQQLANVVVEDRFRKEPITALTVWKKSLVLNCKGFTVFDPTGNIVFRVDHYYYEDKNEVVLMDGGGNSLLTMTRKRFSLQNEWKAFLGDKSNGQKPLFTVRRCSLLSTTALAEIFVGSPKEKMHPDYQIEGSYAKRSCTVYDSSRNVVVEMKRKQVTSEITLGEEVFSVIVQPGYDQAFVMGLIVILDQIVSCDRHTNTVKEQGINFRFSSSSLSLDLSRYLSRKR